MVFCACQRCLCSGDSGSFNYILCLFGSGPLWAADGQTYSQWAFHMVKTGDYLNPYTYGDPTLWIGKPPLVMWLISLAYQAFGVSNFASRLEPNFCCFVLGCCILFWKETVQPVCGFSFSFCVGLLRRFTLSRGMP